MLSIIDYQSIVPTLCIWYHSNYC